MTRSSRISRARWPGYDRTMIISASYRSDIPAFHGDWFLAALAAGEVAVANPYSQRPYLVDLRPAAVDGYVFWTRNARPFARALAAVAAQGKPFVVQYTVLGYPRAIDTNVIDPRLAIDNARAIAETYGRRVVVWRYDPILLTPDTEADWHRANFTRLADALAGITDEVVVSFAQLYAKSARNLAKAGIAWRVPDLPEQAAPDRRPRRHRRRACHRPLPLHPAGARRRRARAWGPLHRRRAPGRHRRPAGRGRHQGQPAGLPVRRIPRHRRL